MRLRKPARLRGERWTRGRTEWFAYLDPHPEVRQALAEVDWVELIRQERQKRSDHQWQALHGMELELGDPYENDRLPLLSDRREE